MSDAAAGRLRTYSGRARYSRSDLVDNGRGRQCRYLDANLRRIVWNDGEARSVLLAAGEDRNAWDALVAEVGHEPGLPLLDLVSAMSLEARTTGARG
jgi:hypothetical protein